MSLEVLYADDSLLIVNKPSGMVVHNGWAREEVVALQQARNLVGKYVYPLHRLDRSASGVLVFALSPELARTLQESWQDPVTVKRYLALVRGITAEQGSVDHALAKEKGKPKQPAVTDFQRLGTFERYSLVLALPKSGRLHQIRRHLKHISHPIIGDVRYGKSEHNRLFRERFGLERLALHALELTLLHPVTRQPLSVRAPLPSDLAQPLERIGLLGAATAAIASVALTAPELAAAELAASAPSATALPTPLPPPPSQR